MKPISTLHSKIVWALIAAMATGPLTPALLAETPPAPSITVDFKLHDVEAARDGSLSGKLLDLRGLPVPGEELTLIQGNQSAARAVTNEQGEFRFAQVRPGVCQVVGREASAVYRVWSADTAPPVASRQLLVLTSEPIVRAQLSQTWQRALLLGGLIGVSGVIGGVIGYNVKDDAS